MTFDFQQILPVASALAGAIVGGVVAEVRAMLQSGRERRRALRVLLYEVLNLRYEIRRRDPRAVIEAMRKLVERKFGQEQAKSFDSPEAQKAIGIVRALLDESTERAIAPRYEAAVDALAPHDPIVAYRLRDQSRLMKLDSVIQDYYKQATEHFGGCQEAGVDAAVTKIESATIEVAQGDALQDLAGDVKELASAIGPITRYRVGSTLRRQDRSTAELEPALEEWLNAMLEKLR